MDEILKYTQEFRDSEKKGLSPSGGSVVSETKATQLTQNDQDYLGKYFGGAQLLYPDLESNRGYTFEWLLEPALATTQAGPLYKNIIEWAPPVKRAYDHFRRGILTEWKLTGDTPQMQAYLDEAIEIMDRRGEPFDTALEKLVSYGYWGGAYFCEVVIDEETRDFIKFNSTDPFRVRFKPFDDEREGFGYELGIYDKDSPDSLNFRSLQNDPLVTYQVLRPGIDTPYADPFIKASVFPVIFSFGTYLDVRAMFRWGAQPKQYIKWDLKTFGNLGWTETDTTKFLDEQIKKTEKTLEKAGPGCTIILPGGADFNTDTGAMGSNALGGVSDMRDIMVQLLGQALDVPALVLNDHQARAQSWSKVTMNDLYLRYHSIQSKTEDSVGPLFTNAANLKGVRGTAKLTLTRNDDFQKERQAEVLLASATAHEKILGNIGSAKELQGLDEAQIKLLVGSIFKDEIERIKNTEEG